MFLRLSNKPGDIRFILTILMKHSYEIQVIASL